MQRKNLIILSIIVFIMVLSITSVTLLFPHSLESTIPLSQEEFNSEESPNAHIIVEAATLQSISLDSPQKVKVKPSMNGAVITWKSVKDATAYEVFRKDKGEPFKKIAQTEVCKLKDVGAASDCEYKIRAIADEITKIVYSEYSSVAKYKADSLDPNKPMIALTFDDGPSIYTKEILKVLKKYHAHATFFIVGERVTSTYVSTIKKAVKIGCEIGNHSYNHANLGTSSKSVIKSQLNKTDKRIKSVIGSKTTLVRPPYGSVGSNLRSIVEKPMILWSIDTLDWKTRNATSTIKTIMGSIEDGDIVLMHDLYSESKEAAVKVIPKLIKKGYQLVTVSELIKYKGIEVEDGTAYSSFKK